jgi:ATP-dependent protease HslVU (ClpYQ) peptidase subunit
MAATTITVNKKQGKAQVSGAELVTFVTSTVTSGSTSTAATAPQITRLSEGAVAASHRARSFRVVADKFVISLLSLPEEVHDGSLLAKS